MTDSTSVNFSIVVERVKKLVSKLANVPETCVRISKVEFAPDSTVMQVMADGRYFRVNVGPDGGIRYVEEIIDVNSTRFCIDKKSAMVIVSRRFPLYSIEDVVEKDNGFIVRLVSRDGTRKLTLFVSCDGSVKKISGGIDISKIIRGVAMFKKIIDRRLLRRIQQLRH